MQDMQHVGSSPWPVTREPQQYQENNHCRRVGLPVDVLMLYVNLEEPLLGSYVQLDQ